MATNKILQVPRIIELEGSCFRIAHPSIKGNVSTSLAAPIAAAGTAMSVYDNNGFADNDWILVGEVGMRETATTDVNGAVTRGQGLTVTNLLPFGYGLDTPVTKIFERGIKIYGAATDGGAGTLIASIDAITALAPQLEDAVMVQWDKEYTEFNLISTDTTYAYYYAKFTDGVTDSAASVYVPSTGLAYTKIQPLVEQALVFSNSKIDNRKLTREMFVDWYNDCQDAVKQYVYQDPGSGRWLQKDWSFEVVLDEGISLTEGEDEYLMSDLTYETKYPNSDKSIMSVQIGDGKPLRKIAVKDMDILRRGVHRTNLNGALGIGDTTINVDSAANFASSGSLTIDDQIITYTGKTATSFTGIPASGTGSITAIIADDTAVWQGTSYGEPYKYTLFNGKIILDKPVSSSFDGMTLKVRHFKSLPRITSLAEGTEIPFTNVITMYLAAVIQYRLGMQKEADKWMTDFKKQMTANAQADFIPILDEWHYYNFTDGIYEDSTWDV